jgi:hypothetical protein
MKFPPGPLKTQYNDHFAIYSLAGLVVRYYELVTSWRRILLALNRKREVPNGISAQGIFIMMRHCGMR